MAEGTELVLRPIGCVSRGRKEGGPAQPDDLESVIVIERKWAHALDGIDGFSHIWIIWWLDRAGSAQPPTKVHPEGRPEIPLVGLFATRSPLRPNPIAMTAVRLVDRQGTKLRVQGLDAFEGTPILDIKPYLRRGDLVAEPEGPDWLEELWRIHDAERGMELASS